MEHVMLHVPRGFWKALHDTLLNMGLLPVPYETSAYYLPGPDGEIHGLLGCHVDDLLWAGGEKMQETMLKVQKVFKFGVVEGNQLKYCGRVIDQSEKGIKVTCPNVLDRTKAIHVGPARRKGLADPATNSEISQLRSVVGSLSWLGRVCRPDICYGVNQLQAVQQKAQVKRLLEANKLLSYAMRDKSKGIFYPAKAFTFEKAVLLSINDASHAASFEGVGEGVVAGHRSQSGRLLPLADESFLKKGEGPICLLEWSSNTIRRVCRSTLQADAMSLLQGSESAEHVRQIMYVIKNLATNTSKKDMYQEAADHMKCIWCTDCRSLSAHLTNPAMSEVSDKRLAIDLTALRQEIWRAKGEAVGNPTYTDTLPPDGSTSIRWVSTKTMAADGLTKVMKCQQLEDLMKTGMLLMEFEHPPVKIEECENSVA